MVTDQSEFCSGHWPSEHYFRGEASLKHVQRMKQACVPRSEDGNSLSLSLRGAAARLRTEQNLGQSVSAFFSSART
jgi:hypothetical protein